LSFCAVIENTNLLLAFTGNFFLLHAKYRVSQCAFSLISFIVISSDASNLLPSSFLLPRGKACLSCRNSRSRECSRRRCLETRSSIHTSATYARSVAFRDGAVLHRHWENGSVANSDSFRNGFYVFKGKRYRIKLWLKILNSLFKYEYN